MFVLVLSSAAGAQQGAPCKSRPRLDHYRPDRAQPVDRVQRDQPAQRRDALADRRARPADRAVVRRAERATVALVAEERVNPSALAYLNRLSDHLFVAARSVGAAERGDVLWQPGATREN